MPTQGPASSNAKASCDQRSEQRRACPQPLAVVALPVREPHVMDRTNDKTMATVQTAKNTMLDRPICNAIFNEHPDTNCSHSQFTGTAFTQPRDAGNNTIMCCVNMCMADLFT